MQRNRKGSGIDIVMICRKLQRRQYSRKYEVNIFASTHFERNDNAYDYAQVENSITNERKASLQCTLCLLAIVYS